MKPLAIDESTHVLVLTGAGVSKESGIPTFRDAGGLWENHRVEEVASPAGFEADPLLVWRFYGQRRRGLRGVLPNAGHRALADLEKRLGDRMLLVTQNVDGLHAAAGSTRVLELHGNLTTSRCSRCDRAPFEDHDTYDGQRVPACGECHARGELALLRPHIVWFGERLDPDHFVRIERFMRNAAGARFLFLAVGTSGLVEPAASFVDAARRLGAETWLVNFERAANTDAFHHFVEGPSGVVLPELLGSSA